MYFTCVCRNNLRYAKSSDWNRKRKRQDLQLPSNITKFWRIQCSLWRSNLSPNLTRLQICIHGRSWWNYLCVFCDRLYQWDWGIQAYSLRREKAIGKRILKFDCWWRIGWCGAYKMISNGRMDEETGIVEEWNGGCLA